LPNSLFYSICINYFQESIEGIDIDFNGLPINNIKYADDTVILVESIEELQQLLNSVTNAGKWGNNNINTYKENQIYGNQPHIMQTFN